MSRRPTRTAPVVIVPGWQGSEPGHWQVWLAQQLREAGRDARIVAFTDVDRPSLADWLETLRATIVDLPETGYDVVAHSLGAVLWLHHIVASGDSPRPDRVALVAPPSPALDVPELIEFFPPPMQIDTVRRSAEGTVLVGGSDDPYLPDGIAATYGRPLKMATTVIEGAGHINVASGYGPWPAMLDWCNRDNLAFF